MRIKIVKINEVKNLIELQNSFESNYFVKSSEQHFYDHYKQGFILGLYDKNKIVGYSKIWFPKLKSVMGKELGLYNSDLLKLAYLNGTLINPQYRGHNYQRKMHEIAIKILKKKGFKHLMCMIHPDNYSSIHNIQSLGLELKYSKQIHKSIRNIYYKKID